MSFSTFSGPIRSGTVREGTVAQGRNCGLAVLAQSYDSGDLTGTATGNIDTLIFNLPKGSQITDIVVDQVVAATAGTTTISVGNASGGAQLMAAVATTAGGRFRGTATAATQLAWQTSTSADTTVYVRLAVATATLTAGRFILTVQYVQRADNGTQNPVSA
jgi:hypothetical protein